MKTRIRLFLALVALILLADEAWSAQQIHLLAVATNRSKKRQRPPFDHYAKNVRRAWTKHHKGRFQAHSLLGPKATRDNVLNAIRRLEQSRAKKTLSVIYSRHARHRRQERLSDVNGRRQAASERRGLAPGIAQVHGVRYC